MKEWIKISLLLCLFGIMRENKPSEPFVTDFLSDKRWRNVTTEQINKEIYPIGTYGYGAQLIIIFLIMDFLRYKPVIILGGICGIIVWSLLLWTSSLVGLQVLEVFYGTYLAAEVAYYTYIYAKVEKKHYSKVTSYVRAAGLCGRLIGNITSQLLMYFGLTNSRDLNYITLATQITATVIAFLLPNVHSSLYFHTDNENKSRSVDEGDQENFLNNVVLEVRNNEGKRDSIITGAFKLLWSHFVDAYTNWKITQWSILFALIYCTYMQVITYIQVLWISIDDNSSVAWNGAAEGILNLLGTIFSLFAGYFHDKKFSSITNLGTLAVISMLMGLSLLLCAWATNLCICYAGYILFGSIYAFGITIASAEIATLLKEESYGLIFGINTFVAVILQMLLTAFVLSSGILVLNPAQQYTQLAFYCMALGILYLGDVFIEILWKKIKVNNIRAVNFV